MKKQWVIVLSVVATLTLLLSGCQTGPTAEEIVAKMQEVEASTDDAHAVVAFSVQAEDMDVDMNVVVELWEQRPGKLRAEVLEASEADIVGVVSVTDGEQAWLYHPGEDVVVTGALGDLESDEIPVDPQQVIGLLEEGIQWAMDNFDVKLAGEEELNGVATYKLEFTPREDEDYPMPIPADAKATLWVEKERWIALQAHVDGSSFGEGWVRVRSFEFNTGLDDALFQFEIPEGAKVIDVADMQPTHLTLDEAEAQAGFDLLVPTYEPDGVTLIAVFSHEGIFVLRYDHSATSFVVQQRQLEEGQAPQTIGKNAAITDLSDTGSEIMGFYCPNGDCGEEITVRGQTAMLFADEEGGNNLLSWVEDGVNVTIAGHISADEIVKVAESLQ
jgi:outer membrane lipoprotein-sorting protein